jgi:hypothetical protein
MGLSEVALFTSHMLSDIKIDMGGHVPYDFRKALGHALAFDHVSSESAEYTQ